MHTALKKPMRMHIIRRTNNRTYIIADTYTYLNSLSILALDVFHIVPDLEQIDILPVVNAWPLRLLGHNHS